jgi:hypothetical protein
MTIEICRKSSNEAWEGLVPRKHEYGRARWEEGLDLAISGQVNHGKGRHHRRWASTEDVQAKKSERWPMAKERGGTPQWCPKATINILMVKYKEGRAGIRGHKNWTIRNTKLDSPVSLSSTSTSTTKSSSGKWSRAPPHWNAEGQDHNKIMIRCLTSRSGH